ncbi:hypothetical protein BLNAU_10526 [Blattamonas nauphoetae]|uniref:Uncharacterized protein n=1 Tax=Blattamonas nauphoetae TaxID=2049346 RepID=A0ABQ9XT12_9EUKA|nr:hypothetical protein BLNAU_10526 [Blattamonas nauphoetae]
MIVEDIDSIDGHGETSNRSVVSIPLYKAPTLLQTLPPLDFTDPSHFSVNGTVLSRTTHGRSVGGYWVWSSVLLSDPFTCGVVSVTITILNKLAFSLRFGLMDSAFGVPDIDTALGYNIENSLGLHTNGSLQFNIPSSRANESCFNVVNEGDCVRMEVDMDSTPRTVQFKVNGEAGRYFMSGIPSSIRIGFSTCAAGSSIRIDNISRLSQPTPISEDMVEQRW